MWKMISKGSHCDLSSVAETIRTQLSAVPELVHFWRFLAGVLYALSRHDKLADSYSSTNVPSANEYIQETNELLSSILEKRPPNRGWLKGFYYNAALMRLDACYERSFRAYLDSSLKKRDGKCPSCGKDKIDGPYLYEKIRNDFGSLFPEKAYEKSNFGRVRHEVNGLKHYEGGAEITEREQSAVLHAALTELTAFLKHQKLTEGLIKKFSGKGIVVGRKTNHK
jgi:hypothetical protein